MTRRSSVPVFIQVWCIPVRAGAPAPTSVEIRRADYSAVYSSSAVSLSLTHEISGTMRSGPRQLYMKTDYDVYPSPATHAILTGLKAGEIVW